MNIPSSPTFDFRLVQDADQELLVALWNEPHINAALFGGRELSSQIANQTIISSRANSTLGFGSWLVYIKNSDLFVGIVSLLIANIAKDEPKLKGLPEPIIALTESACGSKYSSELMDAILRYAFVNLDLSAVAASVDTTNLASQVLVRKRNFEYASDVQSGNSTIQTFHLNRANWYQETDRAADET